MKKVLLLLFFSLFVVGIKAQNCNFSYSQAGALYTYQFTPNPAFPSPLYSYLWDFGDGSTSNLDNPTHTYNSAGNFNVCYTILDSNGTSVCTACQLILAGSSTGCPITFALDSATANTGLFSTNAVAGTTAWWSFSDGTPNVAATSVTHTFPGPGTYMVCVNFVDNTSGASVCQNCINAVIVQQNQNCSFTATSYPAQSNVFDFQAYANGGVSYMWDFGDGSAGTGMTNTHTYPLVNAVYYVCLTTTDFLGSVCTYCDSIVVNVGGATCSYTYLVDSLNPFSYTFFAQPSLPGSSVVWNFGDNSTGTGSVVTHTYAVDGLYNVCMDEVDTNGTLLCTYCYPIQVTTGNNNCSFTYQESLLIPGQVTFFGIHSSPSSYLSWDFGNGSSGTGDTITNMYTAPGTYYVCMHELGGGAVLCSYCTYITVGGAGNCTFTYIVDSMQSNVVSFFFTPNSSASLVSWDFGDGSAGQGANITHTYAMSGTYTVCVNEIDINTGTTLCQTCMNVTIFNAPGCYFSALPDSINPLALTFNATVGSGSTASWDFGDNSTGLGTSVQHTYASAGTYTVCMFELDSIGAVLCQSCQTITLTGGPAVCRANFIETSLGLNAFFIDLSTGTSPATGYTWSFGDGTSSNSRFPQHTYAAPGTYTTCLTINDGSCNDQFCSTFVIDTAVVNPTGCQAYFVNVQLAPYQIVVVNLSSGVNLNFNWDFGDGTTSTQPYPSHYYNSIGTYNLCLTIDDGAGCTDTYCDTLAVDSLGNIFRGMTGFTINVLSPSQLTGVQDVPGAKSFSAYPNPVRSELTVTLTSVAAAGSHYRVYNVQGALVAEGPLNRELNTVPAETWGIGLYILEVTDATGARSYQQLVKE